jgi:hypothetical protein
VPRSIGRSSRYASFACCKIEDLFGADRQDRRGVGLSFNAGSRSDWCKFNSFRVAADLGFHLTAPVLSVLIACALIDTSERFQNARRLANRHCT